MKLREFLVLADLFLNCTTEQYNLRAAKLAFHLLELTGRIYRATYETHRICQTESFL